MKLDYNSHMKARSKGKTLTFGEFVAGVYDTCGKRKARGIVHLAIALNIVEFRGAERIVIS